MKSIPFKDLKDGLECRLHQPKNNAIYNSIVKVPKEGQVVVQALGVKAAGRGLFNVNIDEDLYNRCKHMFYVLRYKL